MVKKNIYEKANEALTAYNEALTTNNSLQVKNETAKNRAAKVSIHLVFKHFIFYELKTLNLIARWSNN